jgi:hypothetical protein
MAAPPTLIISQAIKKDMASCKPKTPSAPRRVSERPASQYLFAGLEDAVVFKAAAKSAVVKPNSKSQQPPASR